MSACSRGKSPDRIHSATEAPRHVGAVELTPRPTAIAKLIRIEETAVAMMAPAMTGVHCRLQLSEVPRAMGDVTTGAVSVLMMFVSAQAEERQDGHDDHDQADEINQSVHGVLLSST